MPSMRICAFFMRLGLFCLGLFSLVTPSWAQNRALDAEGNLGLTRLWLGSIASPITNEGNEEIRFIIPRESTVAFSLTKESITGPNPVEIPPTVEVLVTLDTGTVKEVVSSRERGLHGRTLGVEGAIRLAEVRKELLERRGATVEETVQFVPFAIAYVLTRSGHMQAMDAETGSVIWQRRIDTQTSPILGFDVSDRYIAITCGGHIKLLDARTGTTLKKHGLRNLPDGAPVVAGSTILSPGTNGRIEMLTPYQGDRFRSDMGGFNGRLALAMTELQNAYVWAVKDRMFVSLKPSPARPVFSVPTVQPLHVAPGGFGNMMLIAEQNGTLKCFSQTSGLEVWTDYAGAKIVQTPTFIQWSSGGETTEQDAEAEPSVDGDQTDDDSNAEGNVFGGAATNPFGGAAANPPGAQDNPFGGAATNPFGGGDRGADPFGGGATRAPIRGLDDDDDNEEGTGIRLAVQADVDELLGTTDQVAALLVGEDGNLRAINMRNGRMIPGFFASGIREILTVTDERIYAVSTSNQLVSVDLRSGNRLGAMAIPSDWEGVVNPLSDRVYLQSRTGQIVCFRPVDSFSPKYTRPTEIVRAAAQRSEQEQQTTGTSDENPFGDSNPFGAGANPFGDPGSSDTANPFGGGTANPFGGGGEGASNPFGGQQQGGGNSSNPFGN